MHRGSDEMTLADLLCVFANTGDDGIFLIEKLGVRLNIFLQMLSLNEMILAGSVICSDDLETTVEEENGSKEENQFLANNK